MRNPLRRKPVTPPPAPTSPTAEQIAALSPKERRWLAEGHSYDRIIRERMYPFDGYNEIGAMG